MDDMVNTVEETWGRVSFDLLSPVSLRIKADDTSRKANVQSKLTYTCALFDSLPVAVSEGVMMTYEHVLKSTSAQHSRLSSIRILSKRAKQQTSL